MEAAAKKYGRVKLDAMAVREKYWATRGIQERAVYGADIPGTFMEEDLQVMRTFFSTMIYRSWVAERLQHPNLGGKSFFCVKSYDTDRILGMNAPYLDVGNWGSSFALHVEDQNLYSIHYLHSGDAKVWYSIPEQFSDEVEKLATGSNLGGFWYVNIAI